MRNCSQCGSPISEGDGERCSQCHSAATIAQSQATIDLSISKGIMQTSADANGATIDFSPSSKTVGDATIDLPIGPTVEMLVGPTIDLPLQPTLDDCSATIDPAKTQPVSLERTIEVAWGNATRSDDPLSTLKSEATVAKSAKQTVDDLNIRSHRLRNSNELVQTPAEYELLETIGEGGMGIVYSARQTSIDRTIALKMLRPAFAQREEHRAKFLAEAVATGELEHPNIVPIYDVGATDDGALFYAMKRVRGTPWSKAMHDKSTAENLAILSSVADAIAFAHSRGIIHRDLKPENVMLGDFGEVLVMDWGIALAQSDCKKSGILSTNASISGTPAYMAPEMATGPLSAIGPHSDVYLLGAILFEIVTGGPPHDGDNVMKCLLAAGENKIAPTTKKGELIEIARHAMRTAPSERYASVRDFQEAIRTYQSHSESIALAARAEDDLHAAIRSRKYEDFARALFAFQESQSLWNENRVAKQGETAARKAYAACALEQGDLDLGLSLLHAEHEEHRELHALLTEARREREAKQTRILRLRRLAAALALAVFLIVSGALFWINHQKQEIANALVTIRDRNERLAEERKRADAKAEEALRSADEALRAQRAEAYASYLARIGTSAERVEDNAFLDADKLLETYADRKRTPFRNWEWSYLRRLCRLAERTELLEGRGEALSLSSDGRTAAAGTARGTVIVWRIDPANGAWRELQRIDHDEPVSALHLSAKSEQLFIGTESGNLERFVLTSDEKNYELSQKKAVHAGAVTAIVLDSTEKRLASSSRDETIQLLAPDDLSEQRILRGHIGPVNGLCFSTNDRLLSAGSDATVRVWSFNDSPPIVYRGHRQAVYAVAASPDGKTFASAGRDREIQLWNDREIREFDFDQLERDLEEARVKQSSAPDTEKHHEPAIRLLGHTGEIRSLAFSSQGAILLSGGNDNTVRYWNFDREAKAVESARVFRGHGGWVRAAKFTADDRRIVSVAHDERLNIWDPVEYREVDTLTGHEDAVLSAAFSPQGDRIVTAGRDRRLLMWDSAGRAVGELSEERETSRERAGPVADLREGHEFLLSAAAFLPRESGKLATAAGDGSVRIWDLRTGSQVRRLEGTGTLSVTAVSPREEFVLTGSDSSDALFWDIRNSQTPPQRLAGHKHAIAAAAFGNTGTNLAATGDIQGVSLLWRRRESDGQWQNAGRLEGHLAGFAISAIRFSPDDARVYIASQDQTVMQWNVSDRRLLSDSTWKHEAGVKAFDLSSDGSLGVTLCANADRGFRVAAWRTGEAAPKTCDLAIEGVATSIALSANGSEAWIAANRGDSSSALRWDLRSPQAEPLWPQTALRGVIWALLPAPDPQTILAVGGNNARLVSKADGKLITPFRPHAAVTSAEFSPDGKRLASGGTDGDIKLWCVDSDSPAFGKVENKIARAHEIGDRIVAVNTLAFDRSGKRLATAGDDSAIKLWNVSQATPEFIRTIADHERRITSVAFSADDRLLLSTSADSTAQVHSLRSDTSPIVLKHPAPVLYAAFVPDSSKVVTGCADHIARVWDLNRLDRPLFELTGHTAGVTACAVSPDATRLATGSQDGTVKLWDLAGGNEVLSLKRHTAEITSVRFSPDGRSILTSANDESAILWRTQAE